MSRIFTGQFMNNNEDVKCPKCKEYVNVREGWIDPYNKNMYVHYKCLSEKRKDEVETQIRLTWR